MQMFHGGYHIKPLRVLIVVIVVQLIQRDVLFATVNRGLLHIVVQSVHLYSWLLLVAHGFEHI